MTEFRKEPGERILDVRRNGETFLLTKAGKPVARLGPVEEGVVEVLPDGTVRGDADAFHRVVVSRSMGSSY